MISYALATGEKLARRVCLSFTKAHGGLHMSMLQQENKIIPWIKKYLDPLMILGSVMIIAGIVLLTISIGWVQIAGGALLAAGLALVSSVGTGKEAIHQQFAKEANIQRKAEIYGPLHAELKKLRERLEEANTGKGSYPKWINGAGNEPSHGMYVSSDPVPTFQLWPELKSDYRIDNFTQSARNILEETQRLAAIYNTDIAATQQPSVEIFTPPIASAFEAIKKSPAFEEWQQKYRSVGGSKYGWFVRVDTVDAFVTPDTPYGQSVTIAWLEEFWARGWLLAGSLDGAASCVYSNYKRQGDVIPPEIMWFQEIFQSVWTEIDSHATYQKARSTTKLLLKQVRDAEKLLESGLLYIRDRYEGGAPPV